MPTTALLLDRIYTQHNTGEGHPERPERVEAIAAALTKAALKEKLLPVEARPASDDELAAVHSREYLSNAKREIERGHRQLSTGDTDVSPRSWEVAIRAAGGVLNAVDRVFNNHAKNAFCAVRPPGHHATPTRGMGFCIVNNVAVAARYAQRKYGADRVLIVDWDVHHGNGTQDVFYSDDTVLFFSTHQHPWYPGTGMAEERGEGKGAGLTINRPLPAGSGRAEIYAAFREALLPATDRLKPDLILVSAGFDSRAGDPLGQFRLTDDDFAELTRVLMDAADEHCGGKLVSVLEGGYSLEGLSSAVTAHVRTLQHA